MNPEGQTPDEFQQAWKSQSSHTQVTIHSDLLMEEVKQHRRDFRSLIFWRDFREVGIALLLIPVWFYLGHAADSPWTFYLTVPALIWVAGFMLIDRRRQQDKNVGPGGSLVDCVNDSLREVDHQIWLLRNVFWWYLLPFCISIMIFFAHVAWLTSGAWWEFMGVVLFLGAILGVVYGGVYYANQRAVQHQLLPRREELLTLLTSLRDETSNSEGHSYDIIPASVSPFADSGPTPQSMAFRTIVGMIAMVGLLVVVIPIIDFARGVTAPNYDGQAQSSGPAGDALASLVVSKVKSDNLVSMAAMVMIDGQVEAATAYGERKSGSGVPVDLGDSWHLGGIAKSVTATMIGRLVEAEEMQWTDTLGEIFAAADLHDDWKEVTVLQLLTDTAGAPPNFTDAARRQRPKYGPECAKARRQVVLKVLAEQPAYPPGSRNEYSNVGVSIAAAMAEEVTGVSWSQLAQREVFEPLKLTSAGFGPPTSGWNIEQPRGHRELLRGKIAVDDQADNTTIMGPSGAMHMSLQDLCSFATEHLRGQQGAGTLLSTETYQLLHSPEQNGYACGWIQWLQGGRFAFTNELIPETLFWHNGSNTMWHALVAFVPKTNTVVAVTSNDGHDKAEEAAFEILTTCLQDQIPSPLKSPFSAVRWQDGLPEVQLEDEWFELIELDEIPAPEIIAFSRRLHDDKCEKRFEEDLVELLVAMKHPVKDAVTLKVRSLDSSEITIRKGVPMTRENRDAIRNAAESDTPSIPPPPRMERSAVSIDDTELLKKRIDEFVDLARLKVGFSGVVLVGRDGNPIYQRTVGYSNLATKTPNTLDTPFRIASLSKQFTAAAILALEADDRLSVQDSVHLHLPLSGFAETPYRGITIHHLLTHTSGLPRSPIDETRKERWQAMAQKPTQVEEYVDLACQCPLLFEPGEDFEYSNFNYRILSALIAAVSGKEYADFMEETLFQPLGLQNTGVARISQPASEAKIADVASFDSVHARGMKQFVPTDLERNYGAGYGSGGIFTSANDLLRWDRVLAGDKLLPAKQRDTLFRPSKHNYACGWLIRTSRTDPREYQTHSGANGGYFSEMVRIPEEDVAIVVLGNTRATKELDEASSQLLRLCRSLPYTLP